MGDPTRIGKYAIARRLGSGGMGEVFLGHSPGGLAVAVKVVHPQLAEDPEFRSRFRKEVAAARAVSGAYTAAVVDADTEAARPWLATVFLEGLTLRDSVAAHGPLPPDAVRSLGAGLAEALLGIHQAGVVHRDLKPSNIMLTPQGPRVIDFGIARAADAATASLTGLAMGSPGYLTPERVIGNRTEPAGDVFSLGAVLAYAATGRSPFGEGPSHAIVYRIVHEPPDLEAVPGGLRELVASCLDKEPDARPTPQEVLDRLTGTEGPQGIGWLPQPVADDITARVTPPQPVPPGEAASPQRTPAGEAASPGEQGRARPTAVLPPEPPEPPESLESPEPVEPVEEPLLPLRRRLVPVLAVVLGVLLLAGLTHPALWPDGRLCTSLASRPMLTSLREEPDEWRERAQTEGHQLNALAEQAETPGLAAALRKLSAHESSRAPLDPGIPDLEAWIPVRRACG
ncbi:serine/threonine-protein kinase [Nonomuraea jiangxiensis]|uniref:Serine/threonine protein kinase n=1 Tax=Nonomuraea jiangxiensis TaxID=633440 RepID=A0A1G9WCX7_9ACTN|nr:serine/threonine-protein kinase [Nonomuraea jiangxiensis]SDM82036.1 Serine/threonine protein kinase [Nonomuraea jiangxiensis]